MRHQTRPKQIVTFQSKIYVKCLQQAGNFCSNVTKTVSYSYHSMSYTDLWRRFLPGPTYCGHLLSKKERLISSLLWKTGWTHVLLSCRDGKTPAQDRKHVVTTVGIYCLKHLQKHYTNSYLRSEV
jgi:hypothetical protein